MPSLSASPKGFEMAIAVLTTAGDFTTAEKNTGGNTLTVPLPANARVGDVLIATFASDFNAGVVTDTPGWVRISPAKTQDFREVAVFHAFTANGLPEAPTFAQVAATNMRASAAMYRVTGASQSEVVAGTAVLASSDQTQNTRTVEIPSTDAAVPGRTFVVAYNNATAANGGPTVGSAVTVNGNPVTTHLTAFATGSLAAGSSSTNSAVYVSNTPGPFTLDWGKTIANSYGVAVTIPSADSTEPEPTPEPEPEATWEVKYYRNGVEQMSATFEGVQSASFSKLPIDQIEVKPNVHDVKSLMANGTFYLAHRGSGDNWTEHTMNSYSSATAFGIKALEVSVCTSSDGVMFCHHDTTLAKMTGLDLPAISQMTWAEIKELDFSARQWLGPNTPIVKPTPVKDVLDAYAGTHVIFIEDKQGTNAIGLLNLMDSYPDDKERLVWKQWVGAGQWQAAKNRGYRVWGYFMTPDFPRLEEWAPRCDIIGVPHTATDENIAAAVALGAAQNKKVICWEVHYRWMRDRLVRLGVDGMMCSNVPYVYATDAYQSQSDGFSTGRRSHGDLPHTTDAGWDVQPQIVPGDPGYIRLGHRQANSYVLGSMCPIPVSEYTLDFEMRYDGNAPLVNTFHAGVWFGHQNDRTHHTNTVAMTGGYHLILRAGGILELMRHDEGETAGVSLGSISGPAPVLGQWRQYRITVSQGEILVTDLSNPSTTIRSTDKRYRGGYFGLQKNYSTADGVAFSAPEFRGVAWSG